MDGACLTTLIEPRGQTGSCLNRLAVSPELPEFRKYLKAL